MLENQVSMQRTVLMDQEEALDVAKRASDAREKEIQRLQAHISEHEKVFHDKHALKQLSQHADNMAAELASLKESMHGDGKKLEVSEIARIDAEKRVNNAIKDKEAALQHVKRLETELETLQKEVNYAEKEKVGSFRFKFYSSMVTHMQSGRSIVAEHSIKASVGLGSSKNKRINGTDQS